MIFSSLTYIVFFIIVLGLMFLPMKRTKKYILLMASYFFYAYWDWRFVLLMFLLSVINYYVSLRIDSSTKKKQWLIFGISFDLVILGVFKYYNFFIDSANSVLSDLNLRFPLLDIILPVGISFIVFEVISYIIDIYRGSKSAKSVVDLSLLVAFFPHLIAGPILKPSHFLPQLEQEIKIKWQNVEIGLQIFVFGLVKKVLIADRLALFVDPVFANPNQYSSATVWLAVIAYAIQIYCDFSGYSDMAIGSAKILGFDIPRNFNMPYISRNITEFWRRWHISLSTWLREYLYYSLGGNRKGRLRTYVYLFIVMLLGGLWHGASWNFVIWGALHGVGLAVHKLYMVYLKPRAYGNVLSWAVTMIFVCFTWVFFRSSDFSNSWLIVNKMLFIDSPGVEWYPVSLMIILPIIVIAYWVGGQLKEYIYFRLFSFKGSFVLFFVLLGLLFFNPVNSSPFIYFQF